MASLGVAVLIGCGQGACRRPAHNPLPLWRRDGEIKCSRKTVGPGWEVNVSRSALGIRGIARPRWQQDVRLLQLRIATGRLRKIEAFVACVVVAACAVPACATLPGVVASCIKNLIAKWAPVVLRAFKHAQVEAHFADEVCCWDSKPKNCARGGLPELLRAPLAFGQQCGLVHYASLLQTQVVSYFVKVVG